MPRSYCSHCSRFALSSRASLTDTPPVRARATCSGNSTPAAQELLAKPLDKPRLAAFALSGFRDWHGVPEGSVQLRGLLGKSFLFSILWGSSPIIRLRGIHVNVESTLVKSMTAAGPCTLQWAQFGIVEISLPSLLSPGIKLTVKDIYMRLRTYGESDSPLVRCCYHAGL